MRSGVLLAGGKALRMGEDKAVLEFKGKKLFFWVAEVLSGQVDERVISVAPGKGKDYGKHLADFGEGQMRIIEDEHRSYGPLGGLISTLPNLQGEYVAVAACDTPFLVHGLFPLLFEKAEGRDGAVPWIGGYYEPLLAVYKRERVIKAIEMNLKKGMHKTVDIYEHLDIKKVSEEEIKIIDPELRSFINFNTLESLEQMNQEYLKE